MSGEGSGEGQEFEGDLLPQAHGEAAPENNIWCLSRCRVCSHSKVCSSRGAYFSTVLSRAQGLAAKGVAWQLGVDSHELQATPRPSVDALPHRRDLHSVIDSCMQFEGIAPAKVLLLASLSTTFALHKLAAR